MRVFDRLRRAVGFCFRTRRRAQLSVLVLLAFGWASWTAGRLVRAERALTHAEQALAEYDFAAARASLKRAGELRPRKAVIWILAAQAARRDGDLSVARDHLRHYEALVGPDTPEGRLEGALQRVQQGQIERDVYHLMSLTDAEHPASEQILEALAVGAVYDYHFDRANFWLHHLLTRFPKNPVGRLIVAQKYDLLGKRDDAAAGCREILADFPDNVPARLLLAGLLLRAQKFEDAANEYEELRRRRPDDLNSLLGLARCRDRAGHAADARPLMRELEDRFPEHPDALLESGRFALKEDRPTDAERLLRRAVELAPHDNEARYHLGQCLERIGKTEEARSHFERMKQIEADLSRLNDLTKAAVTAPRDPAPRREAGVICLRNGQVVEGLRWLQGVLEIVPDDRATHGILADFYQGRGDDERAKYYRQRAGR